jgi:hypothetical protein
MHVSFHSHEGNDTQLLEGQDWRYMSESDDDDEDDDDNDDDDDTKRRAPV